MIITVYILHICCGNCGPLVDLKHWHIETHAHINILYFLCPSFLLMTENGDWPGWSDGCQDSQRGWRWPEHSVPQGGQAEALSEGEELKRIMGNRVFWSSGANTVLWWPSVLEINTLVLYGFFGYYIQWKIWLVSIAWLWTDLQLNCAAESLWVLIVSQLLRVNGNTEWQLSPLELVPSLFYSHFSQGSSYCILA